MKQKFLKDLGIDLDGTTDELLQQFDLNGFMDEISDNRLKEENEKDLLVMSLEQYQKEMFLNTLEKSKEDYNEGKVYSARTIFKGLKEKYGY